MSERSRHKALAGQKQYHSAGPLEGLQYKYQAAGR